MTSTATNPAFRVPVRMAILIAAGGLALVALTAFISSSHETRTVSQVIQEIHEIVLKRPQGGLIGPWWVSAAKLDPVSGRLSDLRIESGEMEIAARSARVVVNPNADTFQFEMWDVVFALIDTPDKHGAGQPLRTVDRHVLGPLPYHIDIVPDLAVPRAAMATP